MRITDPKIEFKGYRESDPERRLLSTEKTALKVKTQWKPQINLDNGLDEMYCVLP